MKIEVWIVGIMLFALVFMGLTYSINSWYQSAGVSITLDNSTGNVTASTSYLTNWANQTASDLNSAQAIPFFGGSFMLLTGVFQSGQLLINLPELVVNMFGSIATALMLPSWFVIFGTATIIILGIFAVLSFFLNR